jgi:lysophospholipase L1-like esterase
MKKFVLALSLLTLGLLPLMAQDATPTTNNDSATAPASTPAMTPFPDGTRWAAIGDSITHGGRYLHFVHFYYMTHFPTRKLTMFNCGWNGEAAWQCIKRYPYDIAPLHATVASIMFGMNDGGRDFYVPANAGKFTEPLPTLKARSIDGYETNLKKLVEQVLKDKTQVIVILPSIYDDTTQMDRAMANIPGYNDALRQEAERARKVAAEEGVPVVDFYDIMNKINQAQQAINPKFTLVGMDRTHPGPIGHLVMAYAFLKAQNVPSDVARFSIKGTDGTVASSNNCTIDQVKVENGGVSFRYSARAIPFPTDWWYKQALDLVPFTKDLDQEVFQVTDLPAGNYDLQMDGATVQTCTAAELAAGVNVSENGKTPEYQQAAKAWHLYDAQIPNYARLRDIVTWEDQIADPSVPRPLTMDQDQSILDAYATAHQGKQAAVAAHLKEWKPRQADLQSQIDAAMTQITAMVQPAPHLVKIVPATATPPANP